MKLMKYFSAALLFLASLLASAVEVFNAGQIGRAHV